MKIDCFCGNVLRDQTDRIPYKAHFVADQDYDDLIHGIEKKLKEILTRSEGRFTGGDQPDFFDRLLRDALRSYGRAVYQCSNCGRVCLDDPDNSRKLQWFKPEDGVNWKRVLGSVKGEGSKPWMKNLVGHWDPSRSLGRLWYDPPPGAKGGLEKFADWDSLERRYHELFELFRADGHLVGALA
jgi:hypothetical protein